MRLLAALLSLTLGLSACATATGPEAASRFDRFEGDATALAAYDRFHVAPVTVSEDIQARVDRRAGVTRVMGNDDRPLGEEDVARNTERLAQALRSALGEVGTLSDAPGPGVLTVAVELTQLNANRPTMTEMRTNPGLDFRSISIGGAGVSGTLSEGDLVLVSFSDAAVPARIDDPALGNSIWSEADRYYRTISAKLADLLR